MVKYNNNGISRYGNSRDGAAFHLRLSSSGKLNLPWFLLYSSMVWRNVEGRSRSGSRIVGLCDRDEFWRVSPDSICVIDHVVDVQINITFLYKFFYLGSVTCERCWPIDVVFFSGCQVHGCQIGQCGEWVGGASCHFGSEVFPSEFVVSFWSSSVTLSKCVSLCSLFFCYTFDNPKIKSSIQSSGSEFKCSISEVS